MSKVFPWLMVGMTILLTSYGQLVIKWQASIFEPADAGILAKLPNVLQLLLQPWVISAFVSAFAASLCWMLAVSRLELSKAYPFMALNFLLVCILAIPIFGESLTLAKGVGLVTVIIGLVIISQG
ncbi:EamA family transporter [Stenotrophomonas rhizophila]|uniref:EamA family transporter n=1 Tax=Stenotrophomonas rhizophila TaxID=216778 RepID=A0A7V7YFB8_9GAMM|nr:EamA family transporter [Stenotrophomonas rhizophila]KAB7629949.1 EamA family transporter [Stenotrophomonas rhizophila]